MGDLAWPAGRTVELGGSILVVGLCVEVLEIV
jgi:hypothetical protein